MSMRVHDLQHSYLPRQYKHKPAAGYDPVNILLLAGIFALSTFLAYSVATTLRYVPALETQRGLTPLTGNSVQGAVNGAGADPIYTQRGLTPAETHAIGSLSPLTGTQNKPWYEKPPYVREELVSSSLLGARTAKLAEQTKTRSEGILKN